jgi:transcriptional regulator with XRE-family HTH domain
MKFNKKYKVSSDFEAILGFPSNESRVEHNASIISAKFISEIEELMSNKAKPMKKKDLAVAIGTSAAYISKIFSGDKHINMETLAKIQDVFDIEFKIQAIPNTASFSSTFVEIDSIQDTDSIKAMGILFNENFKPNYNEVSETALKIKKKETAA